jgi:hypothetical protein
MAEETMKSKKTASPKEQSSSETMYNKSSSGSSKKVLMVVVGIVAVVLVGVLALVGGAVYAADQNADIPVLSNLVERYEKATFDPANVEKEEVLTPALSPFSLVFSEDEFSEAMFAEDVSEEEIEAIIGGIDDVHSYSYDLELNFEGKMNESADENDTKVLLTSNGSVMYEDEELFAHIPMELLYETEGTEVSAAAEMMVDNENLYMKVDSVPAIIPVDLSDHYGVWYKSPIDETTETVGVDTSQTDGDSEAITAEDLEKVEEFLNHEDFKKHLERRDDKVISDVRTRCYGMDLDQDDAEEIMALANETLSDEDEKLTEEELESSVEDLESMELSWCLDREYNRLYEFVLDSRMSDDTEFYMSVQLGDYNEPLDVEAPSDTEDIEVLVTDIEEQIGTMFNAPTETTIPGTSPYDYDSDPYYDDSYDDYEIYNPYEEQ